MSNIRHKILDSLKEDWLDTQYDGAQSFYKKARIEEDGNKLYSYDTLVAEVKDGKPVIYNAQSMTTRRHIKEFFLQKGFDYDEIYKAIDDFKATNGGWKPKVEESLKEDYPFTHDVTIYYGTNEDGTDDKGELEIFVDNRKDFPELTDEEIHGAFKDDNVSIFFNDLSGEYWMYDIKIKDGYWLMYKGCEDSGTKPHFMIEKDLKESIKTLRETGEWDDNDEEFIAWKEYLNDAAIELANKVKGEASPAEGFDKYQGPYAHISDTPKGTVTLWCSEYEDVFNLETDDGWLEGDIDTLAKKLNESVKSDKNKPTKRLVMNQGNVYIFEQTKGSKKSYIVGEDIDKDANTIEKVNKYNNQDEAFTDFFERVGINPNNELKESIKKLNEGYKIYQQVKNGNEIESVEVDEVESAEQAEERVSEIKAETGCGAYSKEVKEEIIKESGTLWTSEITEDDYDKEDLKANQYQSYLDTFDGTVKPVSYEEWLESDWLYNYLYYEFNSDDNEYNEWYDFINSYAKEDLERYYQDYLDDIKEREPEKPKEFDTWFNDYMIDDTSMWDSVNDDLKNNVIPMIDKQVNGAIFITGNYHSNYPDFRKSGPGGKIVKDGDDLIDWLSGEDKIDITYEDNEQLGIRAYDHDGSIGGLLYTLPDDPHKILEIALSTDYYDPKEYEDNNDIVETFKYDLSNDNVSMRDIKKPDLLVPIVNGFRTGITEGFDNSKEEYLKSLAKSSWETGQTYSEGDFEEFKKIGKEEGYDLTKEDFNKYFELYKVEQEQSLKESDNIEGEYTQVYGTEDLDKMETGTPIAVTLLQMTKPVIKTSLFAGKSDDKYYFYDDGGMFAFSKRYIDTKGNVLLTNGVDVTEVNRLNQSINTEQ